MKETVRNKRFENRHKEIYQFFCIKLKRDIDAFEASKLRPRIQDAWRSTANKNKAYHSDNSKLLNGFQSVSGLHYSIGPSLDISFTIL